jgi:hypothetical protein
VKGHEASTYLRRQRRLTEEGTAQTLLLADELLVGPDGHPLDPEMARRAQVLVRSVDNALLRPPRSPHEFTSSIIADAVAVCQQFSDAQIREICRRILERREHAAMPRTAEQLLPRWKEIARLVI